MYQVIKILKLLNNAIYLDEGKFMLAGKTYNRIQDFILDHIIYEPKELLKDLYYFRFYIYHEPKDLYAKVICNNEGECYRWFPPSKEGFQQTIEVLRQYITYRHECSASV